jgi:beta-ring hydroxylase
MRSPTLTVHAAPIRPGRAAAFELAKLGQQWRRVASERMPEARGDIREIVGQPVFVPLYKLFTIYGPIFRLSFGPKTFVVVSDSAMAKQVCGRVCVQLLPW